ncbi:pectate lyase family protein [Qipengyuania qiaonensis]|uniref:Pectate lyase n=1 Tax=Qipengyuania qiaonensis TaxID=2867240 RepID=A0ABS7J7R9_9SPHN|nr:pectate lyase [Qipengyuania qiaonensis]MBX7483370.1 pectate lyase [Qipengyuania qiaonensis]
MRYLWLTLSVGLVACSGPAESGTQVDEGRELWRAPQNPSFPGAEGYGSRSKGGRGGRIMQVVSLADSGPGTLRECIEAMGPRVCVFRVSGVIRFTGQPPRIRHPFITIAGQSAPGEGITLAHSGGEMGRTPLVIKDTNDVIVRHIRIRNDRVGDRRGSEDSITIEKSSHVIIDHVSASWARDELVNGYDSNNFITVSNSMFSWGIPDHDKCALLASDPGSAQHFSFIGNLCAHSGDRNPDINFPPGSCVEVLNNVFYNAKSEFAEVWETYGGTPVAIIGNIFVAGPDTSKDAIGIVRQRISSGGPARVYVADNQFVGEFRKQDPSLDEVLLAQADCTTTIAPTSPKQAYEAVLGRAGAFPRDPLDRQVVGEVRSRSGGIMRAPGTIPPVAAARAAPDTDRDGMPDEWEEAHGSSPEFPDAWEDADGDGVANLDAWLEERHLEVTGTRTPQGNGS